MKNSLGFFYWVHLIVIIFIWASPFWLNWKFILFFAFLYYIQLLIFGNCILTIKQFKTRDKEASFYAFTLKKLGFKVNQRFVARLVDYAFPGIILIIALFYQVLL